MWAVFYMFTAITQSINLDFINRRDAEKLEYVFSLTRECLCRSGFSREQLPG
jgi:hypothetical protein